MKKIKIIFAFMLLFVVASCGYNLANKPVTSSKSREYPKKNNYESKVPTKEINNINQ